MTRPTTIHELLMVCRGQLADMDSEIKRAATEWKKREKDITLLAVAGGDLLKAARLGGRVERYSPKSGKSRQRWSDEIAQSVEEHHGWTYYDAGAANTALRTVKMLQASDRQQLDHALIAGRRLQDAGAGVIQVPNDFDWRYAAQRILELDEEARRQAPTVTDELTGGLKL